MTRVHRMGNSCEGLAGIAVRHRGRELAEIDSLAVLTTGGRQQLQRRQGVARRPTATVESRIQHVLIEFDAGIVGDPAHMISQGVRRQ